MGNAEIDIQPILDARMSLTGSMVNGDIISVVRAEKNNSLVGDSKIYFYTEKVVQNMILRLKNVECGEVELSLEMTIPKNGQ